MRKVMGLLLLFLLGDWARLRYERHQLSEATIRLHELVRVQTMISASCIATLETTSDIIETAEIGVDRAYKFALFRREYKELRKKR